MLSGRPCEDRWRAVGTDVCSYGSQQVVSLRVWLAFNHCSSALELVDVHLLFDVDGMPQVILMQDVYFHSLLNQ